MPATKKTSTKKTTKKKRSYTKKVAKPKARVESIQCYHCNKVSEVPETELKHVKTIEDEARMDDGRLASRIKYLVCKCPKCKAWTQARIIEYKIEE